MKIICDNCRTKYSIADEKVKGKVFKIRCKKCSNIIVVRGNQPQEQEAQPESEDYGAGQEADFKDAPVWHLVIDQQQVGPMTSAEVRDRFAQGEIDADCYIWREGFTDWLRLNQVEEFSDVAQATMVAPAAVAPAAGGAEQWSSDAPGAPTAAPAAQEPGAWDAGAGDDQGASPGAWSASEPAPASWDAGGGAPGGDTSRTDSDNLFGGASGEDPGRDLFASNPSHEAAAPDPEMGSAQPSAGEGNLFGDGPAAAEGGGGDLFGAGAGGGDAGGGGQQIFPSSGEEEPQPAAQLTGTRNENSVLFSLSNLQSLAMGGKAPVAAASAPAATASGPAGADGSGLIDIRSMAGASSAPAPARAEEGLPDLGGFSAPIAAAPVLIPAASDEKPKWLLPVIIGGAAVVVVGIVAVVLVIALKPVPVPVTVASVAGPGQPGQPGTAAAGTATKGGATAATKTEGATESSGGADEETKVGAGEPKAEGKGAARGRTRRSRRSGRRTGRKRSSGGDRKVAALAPEPAPSRKPRRGSRKRDALDDLIDGAVGKKGRPKARPRPAAAAAPASNLPETLSRSQIQGGMRGIKGKVQGCYDRYKVPGLANVQVKIGRNGRVNSARVKGMFSGTPTGACVQAAARSARFAKFKGAPITITYPFILR